MPESASSETRSSSIVTAHRRRPHRMVLISRAITSRERSPFCEWSPDWGWVQPQTQGELVSDLIAETITEQLPIPRLWRDPAPERGLIIDRRGAVA